MYHKHFHNQSFASSSNEGTPFSKNKKVSLINVPQGCYAEVRPYDNVVLAVGSEGIGPCCHILIANKKTGHFILCHANIETNLRDGENGVSSWIKKVCPNHDYHNLEINVGETEDHPRPPQA